MFRLQKSRGINSHGQISWNQIPPSHSKKVKSRHLSKKLALKRKWIKNSGGHKPYCKKTQCLKKNGQKQLYTLLWKFIFWNIVIQNRSFSMLAICSYWYTLYFSIHCYRELVNKKKLNFLLIIGLPNFLGVFSNIEWVLDEWC